MDYGQTKQSADNQPFFTAGVGDAPVMQNHYESENNIDLTNQATSWTPERDMQSIGNKVISSPERTDQATISQEEALQGIINTIAQPNVEPEPDNKTNQPTSFDPDVFRAGGGNLGKRAILEARSATSDYKHDNNAASFYDTYTALRDIVIHPEGKQKEGK